MKKETSAFKATAVAIGGGQRRGETLTDASRRGYGRAAKAAAVVALAGAVAGGIKLGADRSDANNIPSKAPSDVKGYHLETIPGDETAWQFSSENGGNHDPRAGVAHMESQLGHDPQPGDTVWVKNSK